MSPLKLVFAIIVITAPAALASEIAMSPGESITVTKLCENPALGAELGIDSIHCTENLTKRYFYSCSVDLSFHSFHVRFQIFRNNKDGTRTYFSEVNFGTMGSQDALKCKELASVLNDL